MRNYVETRWPGLVNGHTIAFVDSEQIQKENLADGGRVQQEKMADFIGKQNFNNAQISLRVLVSANHRDRWAGQMLDVFPIASAFYVEDLLGAFRNTHLIFNIQA